MVRPWMHLSLVLAIGAGVLCVVDQSQADQQARRDFLPTLRAATACIAEQVAASPALTSPAGPKDVTPAVARVLSGHACRLELAKLVSEHDRLYGPGTGARFLEGAYAADLPRAVAERLRKAQQQGAHNGAAGARPAQPDAVSVFTTSSTAAPHTGWLSRSDVEWRSVLPLAIMGGAALVCLFSLLSARRRKRARGAVQAIVDAHAEALCRRYAQIMVRDDYGVIRDKSHKEWRREKEHFLRNVIEPQVGPARVDRAGIPYIDQAIEAAVVDDSARRSRSLDDVTKPVDYEHACAAILRSSGWSARVTRASRDQGADVIADKAGRRIVLQCKFYSKPVGNKAVQEVVAAKAHVGAQAAVVVSPSGFTPSAKELAAANAVVLCHHEQLAECERLLVEA